MSLFKKDLNKEAMEQEILAYRKLQSLGLTEEFKEFSDLLVKTVAEKIIFAFTTDSIKTMEDFYKVKGEVVARLQPLQEVFESEAIARTIEDRLKEYYTNNSLTE